MMTSNNCWSIVKCYSDLLHLSLSSTIEITKLLLQYGANPNQKLTRDPAFYTTVFSEAITCSSEEMVALFLQFRADPNQLLNGKRVIELTLDKEPGKLRLLLEHGADLNSAEIREPLLLQVLKNQDEEQSKIYQEHVDLLIQHGADCSCLTEKAVADLKAVPVNLLTLPQDFDQRVAYARAAHKASVKTEVQNHIIPDLANIVVSYSEGF